METFSESPDTVLATSKAGSNVRSEAAASQPSGQEGEETADWEQKPTGSLILVYRETASAATSDATVETELDVVT